MWTAEFWKAAVERALRTAVQVLLTLWVGAGPLNVLDVDWLETFGVVGGAALVSLLMSLVPVGPDGSPSWVTDRNAAR